MCPAGGKNMKALVSLLLFLSTATAFANGNCLSKPQIKALEKILGEVKKARIKFFFNGSMYHQESVDPRINTAELALRDALGEDGAPLKILLPVLGECPVSEIVDGNNERYGPGRYKECVDSVLESVKASLEGEACP
jgi:hypothetical protein